MTRTARRPSPVRTALAALSSEAGLRSEVVLLTLLRVGEHVVRVRDRLEPLRGVGARIHVRVQLARQATVRLLDVFGCGTAVNAQYLVVVCQKLLFLSYSVPSSRDR